MSYHFEWMVKMSIFSAKNMICNRVSVKMIRFCNKVNTNNS